jgi:hypothetical protein
MCPKLKVLNLRIIHPFKYGDVFQLMDQEILKEMSFFTTLGPSFHGVDMFAVNHLSLTCSKLITIQFNIQDWNEAEIRNLLSRHSSSLTTVSFGECYLTETLLNSLAEFLSERIQNITLCALKGSRLTGKFGRELLSSCKVLRNLIVFHQRRNEAPSQWWQNSVKVMNVGQCHCSLFLNRVGVDDTVETGHEILLSCRKIRKISLTNLQLTQYKFLSTLSTHNSHLIIISLSECILGADSFCLLKRIFNKSPLLNTIHMTNCHALLVSHKIFNLLCGLPANVVNVFISHSYHDLNDLLLIVSSNLQLELLGFWPCRQTTENGAGCTDCAIHNATLLSSGGANLKIIGEPPKWFSGGFFEDRII